MCLGGGERGAAAAEEVACCCDDDGGGGGSSGEPFFFSPASPAPRLLIPSCAPSTLSIRHVFGSRIKWSLRCSRETAVVARGEPPPPFSSPSPTFPLSSSVASSSSFSTRTLACSSLATRRYPTILRDSSKVEESRAEEEDESQAPQGDEERALPSPSATSPLPCATSSSLTSLAEAVTEEGRFEEPEAREEPRSRAAATRQEAAGVGAAAPVAAPVAAAPVADAVAAAPVADAAAPAPALPSAAEAEAEAEAERSEERGGGS